MAGSSDAQVSSDALAAHLVGYVGEASETQLQETGLTLGAIVGQTGVEKNYNQLLMGKDGARRVVVNSLGREISEIEKIPLVEGRRVQLTLDLAMQKAAEEGLRKFGYWGSAIVIDPASGDVLTLVSLPGHDPNAFMGGIDRAAYQALITDKLRPLQNRAIQGRYSPGSTFKLVVATAALEEGLITPSHTVYCGGGASFPWAPLQMPFGRWPRKRGPASRHREVVQRLLRHVGQHAWCRSHSQVGRQSRVARQEWYRPAERTGQPGSLVGMEA